MVGVVVIGDGARGVVRSKEGADRRVNVTAAPGARPAVSHPPPSPSYHRPPDAPAARGRRRHALPPVQVLRQRLPKVLVGADQDVGDPR